MELDAGQLALIGVIASVVTQGLRLFANWRGYNPGREVITGGLFVISVGLSVAWFGIPEVASGDPMDLARALLVGATGVFGSAALVYNALLNRVLREAD